MAGKYRVGIIGCGGIAKAHASGYRELSSVEIVACADVHPKALEEFQQEFSIPHGFLDFRQMLDEVELDIVSVCTWHKLHAECTIEAAKRKVKGIICEKPMAISLGEADAMLQACAENGVKLAIGHQRRFLPAWNEARRLIANGAVGDPQLLCSRLKDGLLNTGTHAIDGMRFLLQDPATEWVIGQVQRKTDRYERGIRIEDCCVGLIGFAGGARGLVESDIEPTKLTHWCKVYGSEGSLFLTESTIRLINRDGLQDLTFEKPNAWALQAQEMVDWIEGACPEPDEGRCEHRGAAQHGRAAMEIMMAIYESVRIKGIVKMPLETKESPLELMVSDGTLPVETPGAYDIRGFLVRQ